MVTPVTASTEPAVPLPTATLTRRNQKAAPLVRNQAARIIQSFWQELLVRRVTP